jgi:hypothetical protein
MNPKYLIFAIFSIIVVFGFNAFLIQRDKKLFESYYNGQPEYCKTIGCENEKLHIPAK